MGLTVPAEEDGRPRRPRTREEFVSFWESAIGRIRGEIATLGDIGQAIWSEGPVQLELPDEDRAFLERSAEILGSERRALEEMVRVTRRRVQRAGPEQIANEVEPALRAVSRRIAELLREDLGAWSRLVPVSSGVAHALLSQYSSGLAIHQLDPLISHQLLEGTASALLDPVSGDVRITLLDGTVTTWYVDGGWDERPVAVDPR